MSRLDSFREKMKGWRFLVFAGSMLLDTFNVNGLTFDQVSIATHFGIDEPTASWSLSAYALTFGSFLLLAGRAGDVFGHKQIYTTGLIGFTLFALLTAVVTTSAEAFFVFRALQGIAAAATIPTAFAMVANTYEGKARELAVVGLGGCQSVGAIVGTIVGGAFAETSLGYRGLLWLSFGLGVIFSIMAVILLPPSPSQPHAARSLDYVGAFFSTAAALLIVFGFTEASSSWNQAKVIAPIVIGVLLIGVFILWEEVVLSKVFKSVPPLIPRRVWGYKNLSAIFVLTGLSFGGFFLIVLHAAQFLVRVQGRTALIASIMYLPVAIGSLIFEIILGAFYNHRFLPPKWVLFAAGIILVIGEVIFSLNDIHTNYWQFSFPAYILMGLGVACFFINFLNIVYEGTPADEQGLVAGIIQTIAQVSTAVAFGIGSSMVSGHTPEDLLTQYRHSFYFSIACAGGVAVIAAFWVKSIPPKGAEKKEVADLELAPTPESASDKLENMN